MSTTNTNLSLCLSNPSVERILLIAGAYGIIQVLQQDLGNKTGKQQRDLIQTLPVQIFLSFSAAYMVTKDLQSASIAVGIYFGLKYMYSNGETSEVCFEEV